MFTARPNVLRSAIAIALSSFVLPPVKANDVTVKVTGYDHTKGKTYTRQMVFHLGNDPADAASVSFIDEAGAEYTNTFFGSQLAKHGFEVFVATRQDLTKTATGYTTILKFDGKEVVALVHELTAGSVKLMVNPALKDRLTTTVKELLAPEGMEDVPEVSKSPLLSPLTDAGDPEAFGRLLEALKTSVTEKDVELLDGVNLHKIGDFKVAPLKTEKTPFLRQVVHGVLPTPDPGTMLQDSASIFPDPEQSMSIMATGMIHSIVQEEDTPPPVQQLPESMQVAVAPVKRKPLPRVVQELLEVRPLVSFVTTEMTSPEVVSALPKGYPVITFGGEPGQVVLNLDQVNPASLAWIKGATRGIHTGYDTLKIIHVDAPGLREACYHEQAKILKQVAARKTEIAEDDIALLSHYQQLISLLDFVIDGGTDFVFNKMMLQATHLVARGIDLQAHLAQKFADLEDVQVVVHSEGFSSRLRTHGMDCCATQAQLTDDDNFKKLVFHQTVATHQAVQHLQEHSPRVHDLKAEVTTLTQAIGKLQEQVDDNVLPETLDPKLTHRHFTEFPEDAEADYRKLTEAARHHPDTPSGQLKEGWKAARKLTKHFHGQEPDKKVKTLAKEHASIAKFIGPDGKIIRGKDDDFKFRLSELNFDDEKDADVVRVMVHTVPPERMERMHQDTLVLEGVDLDHTHDYNIAVAQTGTEYQLAKRVKRVAREAPAKFESSRETVRTRRWLAEMSVSSDLPKNRAQELLDKDERVVTPATHQQLRSARDLLSERGQFTPSQLARKLQTLEQLLLELDEDTTCPDLLDDLITHHSSLVKKAWSSRKEEWKTDDNLKKFDQELDQIPGAKNHRAAVIRVIKEVKPEEITELRFKRTVFGPLHSLKLLTPEALELGQFELTTLHKIKRARLLIPSEVDATLTRLDSIQQQLRRMNTAVVELVTEVTTWGIMLTEDQLMKLPATPDMVSETVVTALRKFMGEIKLLKATPKHLLGTIKAARGVARLSTSPANPFPAFLQIKEHWETLELMVDMATGALKEGQLENFKAAMTTAGFQAPSDNAATRVARFMGNVTYREMAEKYGLAFIELQKALEIANLTEAQILQAQLDFTVEKITKSRQLMEAQPGAYQTLVELSESLHERSQLLEDVINTLDGRKIEDLITQSEKLEQQVTELKAAEGKSSTKAKELQQQLDDLNSTLEALNETISKAERLSETVKSKGSLREKVEVLTEEFKALKASHLALSGVNEILTQNKDKAEAKVREVEEQLSTITEEVEAKREQVKRLEREQTASRETEEELKKHLPALDGEGDGLVARATALSRKKAEQEQEVTRLRQQLRDQQQQRRKSFPLSSGSGTEGLTERLQNELRTASQKLEQHKTVTEAVQRELDTLAQKHKLTLEGETLEAKAKFLQESLAGKAELLKQMQAKVNDLEATRHQLEELLKPTATVTGEVEPEPVTAENLVQKVTELLDEVSSGTDRISALESEVKAKGETNTLLTEEMTNTQEELATARETLTTTRESLTKTTESLEVTETKVTELETKYPELKTATTSEGDTEAAVVKKPLAERVTALEEYHQRQHAELQEQIATSKRETAEFEAHLRSIIKPPEPSAEEFPPLPGTTPASDPLVEKTTVELVQDIVSELKSQGTLAQAVEKSSKKSYDDLRPKVEKLEAQARLIEEHIARRESQLHTVPVQTEGVELAERLKRILTPKEGSRNQALTSKVQALEDGLTTIRGSLPKISSEAESDSSEVEPDSAPVIAGKIKVLVTDRDQQAAKVETLTQQVTSTQKELDKKAERLREVDQEALDLQSRLQTMTEEKDAAQKTLTDAEATVKSFEGRHQGDYTLDEGDDLPTRLGKAVQHSDTKIEETSTELTRLQREHEQQKTDFEEVTTVLDQAVPDETTDTSVPKKSPLEKVQFLSQTKTEQEQEVGRLTKRVSDLEEANRLAAGDDDGGQLRTEYARLKQELSQKSDEFEETSTKLETIKTELKTWEDAHRVTADDPDDIVARVETLTGKLEEHETQMSTLRDHIGELQSTQGRMRIIVEAPVRLHPADMTSGMPEATNYDILVQVVSKHTLRTDELLHKLQEMERMVGAFEKSAQATHREVLGKMKANMEMVKNFWDSSRRRITSEAKYDEFAIAVGLPTRLKQSFTTALVNIGTGGWTELIEDVLLMMDSNISPAKIPLPHLTMARGGMTYGDLQTFFNAAEGLENYETFYMNVEPSTWLNLVDHPIPQPTILKSFPKADVVITITLNEFRNLEKLLRRHNAAPADFGPLIQKLQVTQQWVSVSEGSAAIDDTIFARIKRVINSSAGETIDAIATDLNAAGQGAALQTMITAVNNLNELKILLEDAHGIGGMLAAGKVTPETLSMAYHGAPPSVVRMAQVAFKGAPQRYQQRFLELQEQATKHRAMRILNQSTTVGILAGDDPVEVLVVMGNPDSGLYKAVKAIPDSIHAGNPEQIRVVHHELTLVSRLITGDSSTDGTVMSNLVNALEDARQYVDASGTVTNSGSYNHVLQKHGLADYKKQIVRICASSLTAESLPLYFEHAGAIKLHNGNRMVSLGVFEAAYEPGWTSEQFRLVKILAETPEVRALAKDAHATSGLRDLTDEVQMMEETYTEFRRLVEQVQQLEQGKLEIHNRLNPVFTELKREYEVVELKKVHLGGADGVVTTAGKIRSAKTFQELKTATDEFISHPRVLSAQELTQLLTHLEELMSHMPSTDELAAMEQFDTEDMEAAAARWIEGAGDDSELRKTELRPALKPLSVGDDELEMDVLANQFETVFGPLTEPSSESESTDAPAAPPKTPILMVVDAQAKMEELYQLQQKPALEEGDLARARELATELGDDEYARHLQLWTGTTDDTVTTLRDELNLLRDAADDPGAKGHLDTLFTPPEIHDSRELNAHLTETVEGLRQAQPHVKTHRKATEKFTPDGSDEPITYSEALQEAVDEVAEHISGNKNHLAPELANNAPAPLGIDDDYPEVSVSHRAATNMLQARQERDALKELVTVSDHVAELEERRISSRTTDEDLDTDFAQTRDQAVTDLESFCEDCRRKKVLPDGTLDDLHEDGVIKPTSVRRADELLSEELSARRTAAPLLAEMGKRGASQVSAEMTSHVKLLSALSDTADAAIPEEFRTLLQLIRDIHEDDPTVAAFLQKMRDAKALRLGDLPEPILTKYAHTPEWQLLLHFVAGDDAIGELGENVLIMDMVETDQTTQLKLSRKVAANMAAAKQLEVQLRKSLELMAGLEDSDEMQATLFMTKAMSETDFKLAERPASPEVVAQQLKHHYGDLLPDSEAMVMGGVIYRGLTVDADSWGKVTAALGKMPKSGPKLFSGAVNQIMNMDLQMGKSLLEVNDAFHRWLSKSPLVMKMVTAVHRYQLTVVDIEAVRTYQQLVIEQRANPGAFKAANKVIPEYPKAANLLQLTEEDMGRIAELPKNRWEDSVVAIARDPSKHVASFAVTQTLKNVGDISTRFILEFILDDINLYGGTGSIAVILGYADWILEMFGLDRDDFLRALLHGYMNDLLTPYFQQKIARWVTPFTSGFQAVRVVKDVYTYVVPGDVALMGGALRSMSFFLLAELNDLTWGGELTKRMALAFRGFDQLVNVQMVLEDRIKRTRNKYARGKITKIEMRNSVKQDLANIQLLSKGGDNWREECKVVVETLRGDDGITDEDIEYYLEYIDSSYSYQHMKKTWEEGVATVSAVLSKGRPFMTPVTSSLPKYMILAGVVDPLVRYGMNAVAPGMTAGAIGKIPAALLGTSVQIGSLTLPPAVLGTLAVTAGTTMYDGMYNDFEGTRQTWYPFVEFVDEHVYGIDFEKAKALGVDRPASWSESLNSTLPWLSMSAPNNMWRSGAGMLVGDDAASMVFGHKKSAVGYVFRPFTYTYQHVMDHLYKHPKQLISTVGQSALEAPAQNIPSGSTIVQPSSTVGIPSPTSTTSFSTSSGVLPTMLPTPSPEVNPSTDATDEESLNIIPSASSDDEGTSPSEGIVIEPTDAPVQFAGNLNNSKPDEEQPHQEEEQPHEQEQKADDKKESDKPTEEGSIDDDF